VLISELACRYEGALVGTVGKGDAKVSCGGLAAELQKKLRILVSAQCRDR
jgi:hypothetical protein